MLAARSFFHLGNGAQLDVEIVAEFAANSSLDVRQARGVEVRPWQIAELSTSWFFLVKLHSVKIIEHRVVHVESSERNAAARTTYEELLSPTGHLADSRPWKLERTERIILRL